jgi:cobalt-zinc-cadmium efflux system outer membrane protein
MHAWAVLTASMLGSPALAQDNCPKVGDAWALARCAQSRSAEVRRASYELDAARGRRRTAEQLLPANPTIEVGVGRRETEDGRVDVDRGVELAQSFEVGGQRGARVALSDVEIDAAKARLDAAERQVAIDVLAAVVDLERARRAVRFASEQREVAQRLIEVSTARARDGVGAGLDVELAEAARVQARREELAAGRALREADAQLASIVGADVQLAEGAPIAVAEPKGDVESFVRAGVERRQLVRAQQAEAEAGRHRIDVLRRERVPNITLAAHYNHEEFSEIGGLRVAVPLPFFRRNQGEIAEQLALVDAADAAAQQAKLDVALEVRASFATWQEARDLLQEIPSDLESRLESDAEALRDAYVRGALGLPNALTSLRETWSARRSVAEARAEAQLATLALLRTSGGSVAPAAGEVAP